MQKRLLFSFIFVFIIFSFSKVSAQTPTAPTGTPGSVCGSGVVTLSASGSLPSGGVYNWYSAASGGISLGTGSTFTTPSLTASTTYYVDYTQGGLTSTPRTAVVATVNSNPVVAPAPTSPTASSYLSYAFSGNANDVSGNSNNGTLQNAPTLTTDRYGNPNSAYTFDGATQYVSTTTTVASPGPQNFSISVWFKTSSAGGKLVGFGSSKTGSSGNYDRHIYMSNSGQIYFGIYPGATKTISTTAGYADGNWHHVVATESATNGANLYIDGSLQASDATMNTSQVYGGYWRIGYDNINGWPSAPTSYYFNGSLDDVAIYNTELTAAQVNTLYGVSTTPTNCGGTLPLQVNTVSGATYSWTGPNGFSSSIQNPSITNATALNAGLYTVTVTSASGCTSQLNVTATVGSNGPILSTAPTSPTANLYLSYSFNGNANDVSGNSNNGILENSPSLTNGHFGDLSSAYSFNGTNQYITSTTNEATPPANFSISVWFKTSSAGGKLVGFGSSQTGGSGNYDRHIYMSNSGQIYFGLYPGGVKTISTTTTYADGNWHHVVATESTTNGANLYVDGVLQATDATMIASQSYGGYWRVGYDNLGGWTNAPSSNYFNGSIDDVAIYNTELTATQVTTLYGIGGSTFCSGGALSLTANTVSGAIYNWSGPGGFSSTSQNPVISSPTAGTYTLVASSTTGCTSTLTLAVTANSISYTGSPYTYSVGTAITSLTPTIGGRPTAITISPALPAGLSINTTTGVISGTPTAPSAATNYMVTATFGSCSVITTINITVTLTNYNWTGSGTNSNWNNTANWATGVVPTASTSATIAATTNKPTVNTASSCYSLIITGNTTLTLSAALSVTNGLTLNGGNLSVAGTKSATFGGASTISSGNSLTTNSGTTLSFNSTTLILANGSAGTNTVAITNGGTLNLTSTTLTEGTNLSINNTGTLNLSGATVSLSNAVASFTSPAYGTNFTSGGDNYSLTNSGTVTAGNNSVVTLNDVGTIYNSGTYIAGTTGSACTLNLSGNGSAIVNAGTFLLGSTSTINLTGGGYNYGSGTVANSVTNNSGKIFALMSDVNGSASIGQITNGGNFSGNFYVQRYLTSSSSGLYHLLSVPVFGGTSTSPVTGYGNLTYLNSTTPSINGTTYPGAATGGPGGVTNGFTLTNANPTIYLYDEAISPPSTASLINFFNGKNVGLTQITSSNVSYKNTSLTPSTGTANIYSGTGFTFYDIGPSTSYATHGAINATTISYYGQLNQSNITFYNPFGPTGNLSYSSGVTHAGCNMVGNPYASTIDLNKLAADNFTSGTVTFYELTDAQNFCSWTYNTSNGVGTSDGTSVQYISSGQGFLVLATGTGQSLTFKEDQKVSTAAPSGFLAVPGGQQISVSNLASINRALQKSANGGSLQSGLHLMLAKDSLTFKTCGIFFNKQASDKLDGNDAKDLDGINPSIYMSSYTADGIRTSINTMAGYIYGKNIKLYVKSTTDGTYKMRLMDIANVDTTNYNVYLVDNYKKDTLNIAQNKIYSFNIAITDSSSFGANRFVLSLSPKKPILPYKLLAFNGIKNKANVTLNWKTSNEGNFTSFGVQKYDATVRSFKTIDSLQSNNAGSYNYVDQNPVKGTNNYRLVQNTADGTVAYSDALIITYGTNGILNVYPNPAVNVVTVNLTSVTSSLTETYDISIYNAQGVEVMHQSASGDALSQDVSALKPGVYMVDVKSKYGNSIGNAKFLKN